MKICPVCQYEEEQDSEASCAICGSDLESSALIDEVPTETEEVIETTEEPSVSDEEKLLEETLAATEVDASESTEESSTISVLTSVRDQWSKLGSRFKRFSSRLDSIFLTKGELNYAAPLTIFGVSLFLFFSLIAVSISSVPGMMEPAQFDGATLPTGFYSRDTDNDGVSESLFFMGDPFSGEPFNCELWDAAALQHWEKEGFVTDRNDNGKIDHDEREGCPISILKKQSYNSLTGSVSHVGGNLWFAWFLLLNTILFSVSIYVYNHVPDKSLLTPVFLFGFIQFAILVIHGSFAFIFADEATVAFVSIVVLMIASSIPLSRILMNRDLENPLSNTIYIFLLSIATLLGALYHNYILGPYAICSDKMTTSEHTNLLENTNAGDLSACKTAGYNAFQGVPIDFSSGENMLLIIAATFLFVGVANWMLSNIKIRDRDEAKYFAMIIAGLVLQFLILVVNIIRSEDAGLGMGPNDITLTVMALGVAIIGLVSFYRKRSEASQDSIGIAYFGILAVGLFALFGTFIAPIVLGGEQDMVCEDRPVLDEEGVDTGKTKEICESIGGECSDIMQCFGAADSFELIMAASVTAMGFWLSYKFGSQKLRQMSAASDAAMPNREDPFAPTIPGEQKAMPEWSVDSAMEFLMNEYGDEFQIELKHSTEHTPNLELVEKTMMDKVDQSVTIREAIQVDYEVDFDEIAEAYSTTRETVDEVITHLTSGKNIMLFGEPGTGKTALANILLSKLCGEIDQPNGSKAPNFTIVTANAEWSNFDVIGGISPDDSGGYYFKDGYVAEAAKLCEHSIRERAKPHYLVIDEFNRANIDEAFGKLFTVFEYRDKQPLLTHKETGGAPFMMPPEFRIIGTMNTQDKNTLFNVGFALMRRFAFVEIGLPDPDDEYHRMPVFVYFKLKKLGLVPERPEGDGLWKFEEKCRHYPSRKFDFYDDDGNMYKCHEKLVKFLEPSEAPKRGDEVALGVRTFRKIGPALIIDSMVTIFNSVKKYGPELALDRVIRSNIMPSLEGLERNEIRCMFLHAKEVLGPNSTVTETLDRMANSDSLSLF